jgi:hypothetical protein
VARLASLEKHGGMVLVPWEGVVADGQTYKVLK